MEGDLLGFREKVIGVAVQRQLADAAHRNEFLRDDLGRVEEVEVEFELVLFLDDLQAQLPLRIVAALDRLEEVATVKIGILARDLLRLIPDKGLHAFDRFPVELDEAGLARSGMPERRGVPVHANTSPPSTRAR